MWPAMTSPPSPVAADRPTRLSAVDVPAGWYPDPDGSGGQRYYDGHGWTDHRAPPPAPAVGAPWAPAGYPPWADPPWKGAQLGRPAAGPGSLSEPGRRLGARALDGLVLLPVLAVFVTIAVTAVAPHAGPIFPVNQSAGPGPTPGIVWIYLACLGAFAVTTLVALVYETVATARYGRTLGKAWLHIRPVRIDGQPMGWGHSIGRVAIYWLSSLLGWIGLIDPLWCLWDDNRQCLHDKVVSTVVVND
jgi:uncharacterized RDD family membrane protein YckC